MDASLVVKAVMATLIGLSLLGWLLIFRLSARLSGSRRDDDDFEAWFWSGDTLPKLHGALSNDQNHSGLAQVFLASYDEYLRLAKIAGQKSDISDGVERKCRVALGKQQSHLESGLPTLASIASVSPYIGLFGTVWGIMTAFIGLGEEGSATLATVAPGIAEALIATAMGLFAAIPASLAFNHFSAKTSALYEARALFCDEVTGAIERQFLQTQHLARTN